MDIKDNVIFIPGATSGIGLALARALQDRGNTLIVGGRRREVLDRLAEEHGFDTVTVDVADPVSVTDAAAQVLARHPDLNVLIAMAGVMRIEDWRAGEVLGDAEEVVTTNLLGPIRLVHAFLPHLLEQPRATVMTVSSGLAFAPLRVTPTYNATKAAIHMLSESLRLQLEGTSVQVVELVPPAVATDLLPGQQDSPIAMPLDDFVDEVLALVEGEPGAREILVENVRFLRHGEARGDYAQVVAAINAADPHGH